MSSLLKFTVLVTLVVGTNGQLLCHQLVGSGCDIDRNGAPATFFDGDYNDGFHGAGSPCNGGQGLFNTFITGTALCGGTEDSVETQLTTNCGSGIGDPGTCSSYLLNCCTPAPTASPSEAPSESPTSMPTDAPSVTPPSTSPTTPDPTVSPTSSPVVPTDSPTRNITTGEACTDFFCEETNVIAVAAGGGGGLLLVVAALLMLRRGARRVDRSESDVPVSDRNMKPKDGGPAQVIDDKIFDWEKHIDKKTGEVYFFNPLTNESRWDPPSVTIKN